MIPKKLVLELAKGFRGRSKNCISIARERVEKALQYAYRFVNDSNSCPYHLHSPHSQPIHRMVYFASDSLEFSPTLTLGIGACDVETCGRNGYNRSTRVRCSDLFCFYFGIASSVSSSNTQTCALDFQMRSGSREHGLKYQQLVHGLNIAGEFAPSPPLYATWSWANAYCAFIHAAANMALHYCSS